MFWKALLLSLCGFLSVSVIGCGGPEDTQVPPAEEQAAEGQQPEAGASEEGQGQAPEGEVRAQARNCQTTCTAVRVDTGEACASVVGYGYTTFLGGCTKACRFARENAEANAAAAGCRLVSCADSCR
jgi:hypothetical protein